MRTYPLLLLVLGLLVGCRGPAEGDAAASSTASVGSENAPAIRLELPDEATVGLATIRVHLLEGDEGIEGAEVELLGTMTHAGMTPVVRTAEETEPGLYVANDFEFTMAGDWILTAEATLPDGDSLEQEATITAQQP